MSYSIYDVNTGEILRFLSEGHTPLEAAAQSFAPTEIVIEGEWDDSLYYVLDFEVVPRPRVEVPENKTLIGNDEDTLVVNDIPPGSMVTITRPAPLSPQMYQVDDGIFEWSTTRPGRYTFEIQSPFPYVNTNFLVTVNAD